MTDLAISIRGVNKSFGTTHAVRDLDLDVPTGSLCGFLGPNGAGKSTTIRMIMSIIYPDSGTVEVLGNSALRNKDRIGFLPEERGLYRRMRVGEFLEYIAKLKGVSSSAVGGISAHVRKWLDRIELPNVFNRRCQELSKGMQQKVQFLAAIIHEPDLIILDEPFSGLDPVNSAVMSEVIRDLNAQGRTIIFSTHVLHQAQELCDRIFLINRGKKLLDATMEDIQRRFDPHTILVEPISVSAEFTHVPGVVSSTRVNGGCTFELAIENNADIHQIMRSILNAEPVRSIELRRPSLTDVFVRLVNQDQGAKAAAEVREELVRA